MESPFSLKDKTILITGASSGIGQSVAIECAKMGAKLVITARNRERLDQTFSQLQGSGHSSFIADLSNEEQVAFLVEELPKIDGVVCCAGVANTLIAQISDSEDVKHVFGNNTYTSIYLIQNLLQSKRVKKSASIVFISSISGVYCAYAGGTLYGASKGALEGYAKALALELAPRGVRVNTICPGMVATELLHDSNISQEQLDEDAKRYPLKRYGTPTDVAYAAIYLLSDTTIWMTGSSIKLDGGYTLQ